MSYLLSAPLLIAYVFLKKEIGIVQLPSKMYSAYTLHAFTLHIQTLSIYVYTYNNNKHVNPRYFL